MPRWVQFALFFAIVTTVYFGAHFYVYRRLVSVLELQASPHFAWITTVMILLTLSFPVSRLLVRGIGLNFATKGLDLLACAWMGLFFYIFLWTVTAHLVSFTIWATGFRPALEKILTPRVAVSAVAAGAIAFSIYAYFEARWTLAVTNIEVPVKNLPAERDGFTIAQLSDIHMGAIVADRSIRNMVREVNRLRPDLVLITGDLADEDAAHLEDLAKDLKELNSANGVFAVTGNHDFYAGVDDVVKNAAAGGVKFLRNEKITVAGFLDLYGADDPTSAQFTGTRVDPTTVIGPEAAERPSILMYHQPIHIEAIAAKKVDLILSGHTHKGQIWPISHISRLFYPFQTGLYKIGGTSLYVSRGIGTWGPPMRLDAPPEVVLIKLRKI